MQSLLLLELLFCYRTRAGSSFSFAKRSMELVAEAVEGIFDLASFAVKLMTAPARVKRREMGIEVMSGKYS